MKILNPQLTVYGPRAKNYFEKFTPFQNFGRFFYQKKNYENKILKLINSLDYKYNKIETIKLDYPRGKKPELMSTAPFLLNFLQMIIKVSRTKHVLEVGTFLGFSSIAFSQVLPPNGSVTTIEIGQEFSKIAENNLKKIK